VDFTYLRPRKVYDALDGHPDRPSLKTVERWCAGQRAPEWVATIVREKLEMKETPQPEWARGLQQLITAGFTRLGVSYDDLLVELQSGADQAARVARAFDEAAARTPRTPRQTSPRRRAVDRSA
jgi:hypothetical protein